MVVKAMTAAEPPPPKAELITTWQGADGRWFITFVAAGKFHEFEMPPNMLRRGLIEIAKALTT